MIIHRLSSVIKDDIMAAKERFDRQFLTADDSIYYNRAVLQREWRLLQVDISSLCKELRIHEAQSEQIVTTVIYIDTRQRLATVTRCGMTRLFRLLAIDPFELVKLYTERGYVGSWSTPELILLTKKVSVKHIESELC